VSFIKYLCCHVVFEIVAASYILVYSRIRALESQLKETVGMSTLTLVLELSAFFFRLNENAV